MGVCVLFCLGGSLGLLRLGLRALLFGLLRPLLLEGFGFLFGRLAPMGVFDLTPAIPVPNLLTGTGFFGLTLT